MQQQTIEEVTQLLVERFYISQVSRATFDKMSSKERQDIRIAYRGFVTDALVPLINKMESKPEVKGSSREVVETNAFPKHPASVRPTTKKEPKDA